MVVLIAFRFCNLFNACVSEIIRVNVTFYLQAKGILSQLEFVGVPNIFSSTGSIIVQFCNTSMSSKTVLVIFFILFRPVQSDGWLLSYDPLSMDTTLAICVVKIDEILVES